VICKDEEQVCKIKHLRCSTSISRNEADCLERILVIIRIRRQDDQRLELPITIAFMQDDRNLEEVP